VTDIDGEREGTRIASTRAQRRRGKAGEKKRCAGKRGG